MAKLASIGAISMAAIGFLLAQGRARPGQAGMMDNGMGKMDMMGDPIHQSVVIAFALPEMQAELGLSEIQTSQLKQDKQELLAKGQELSAQAAAKHKELESLISAGDSKNDRVKSLFGEVANLRAQQEFAAFEAAGTMKARLTDQQRARLASMMPGELHQVAMSHITVHERSLLLLLQRFEIPR